MRRFGRRRSVCRVRKPFGGNNVSCFIQVVYPYIVPPDGLFLLLELGEKLVIGISMNKGELRSFSCFRAYPSLLEMVAEFL